MKIEGHDIRKELNIVCEAMEQLNEKFLRAQDPTVAVGGFIEDVDMCLSNLKVLYDSDAKDRNAIVGPARKECAKIVSACQTLMNYLGKGGKEDVNKGM